VHPRRRVRGGLFFVFAVAEVVIDKFCVIRRWRHGPVDFIDFSPGTMPVSRPVSGRTANNNGFGGGIKAEKVLPGQNRQAGVRPDRW
jgi:hypothetical protein